MQLLVHQSKRRGSWRVTDGRQLYRGTQFLRDAGLWRVDQFVSVGVLHRSDGDRLHLLGIAEVKKNRAVSTSLGFL